MAKISMKKECVFKKNEIKKIVKNNVFLCKNISEKITFWFTTSYQHFLVVCGNVDNFF